VESAKISHGWTILTNHAHVLAVLQLDPEKVLREVAIEVGITERAVQRIIQDLEEGGFIERERVGRQNRYHIPKRQSLRHPIEADRKIGDLLKLITGDWANTIKQRRDWKMNKSAALPVVTSTSKSDLLTMQQAAELLGEFNVSHERHVASAHRKNGWMASVIVCLCTFSLLMPPQVATLVSSAHTESENPVEEDTENTAEELVNASSRRRRREQHRVHNLFCRNPHADHRAPSYVAPACLRTGHQRANGLAAPLLI
jgi:DNA-binding Lrp family transcriptional regulator